MKLHIYTLYNIQILIFLMVLKVLLTLSGQGRSTDFICIRKVCEIKPKICSRVWFYFIFLNNQHPLFCFLRSPNTRLQYSEFNWQSWWWCTRKNQIHLPVPAAALAPLCWTEHILVNLDRAPSDWSQCICCGLRLSLSLYSSSLGFPLFPIKIKVKKGSALQKMACW